jgi:carbohydrate-selective porin OprB
VEDINQIRHTYFNGGITQNQPAEAGNWQPGISYQHTGTLGVAETGFRNFGKEQIGVGGWEYNAKPDAFTPPDQKPKQGMYVLAERTMYNEDNKTITGFARAGRSAGNLDQTKNGWSTGLIMKGFMDDRPDGQLALAVTGGGATNAYTANSISMGGSLQTRVELTYIDKIGDNMTFEPGLNFNVNPGNNPEVDRGLVAGFRIHVKFK